MTLISWICFFILFLILLSMFRKGADVLSPARVFGFVWAMAIGLADLKLSGFQHTWSLYSWIVLLSGVFALLIGIFIFFVSSVNKPLLSIQEIRERLVTTVPERIDVSKLFKCIIFLFVAYLVSYVIEVMIEGNVPLFSPRPDILRVEFGVFGLHLIVNAMMSVVLLAVEYLLLAPRTGHRKLVVNLIIFISIVTYLFLLQRYTFFVVIVIAVVMIYYCSWYLRPRNLIPFAAVFVTLLYWINSIRSARYVQAYLYLNSKMRFSKSYWILAEPYMYITMNLENFTRAVDKLDHYFYGYFTFDWMLALAGLKHWMEKYFYIEKYPFLISGYNTFTFHWWYYYDFGVIGVIALPLIEGLIIGYLYYRLRTKPDMLTVMLYF